jgi:uncharacterized iron-regulated protein
MGSVSILRSRRRLAGERHAMLGVERELRACDPLRQRKYLRNFYEAFSRYDRAIDTADLQAELRAADIILIGDYHALPAAQHFAAQVARTLAGNSIPVALGLEAVFARDQTWLDAWQVGKITGEELRHRLHFDACWGYDWQPWLSLLEICRDAGAKVWGLDCPPRNDMRAIAARDRHAAAKIAEIRQHQPAAKVVALMGESHCAPQHLPRELKRERPTDKLLTLLQNVDALYRQSAAGGEPPSAVRVAPDIFCVFNATPLEKYESYRLCVERWRQERPSAPDLRPSFMNLLDALLHFLRIEKYSSHNTTQPRFLVDLLPEICARPTVAALNLALERLGLSREAAQRSTDRARAQGSLYLPECNVIAALRFEIAQAAEDVTRFLHRACHGALRKLPAEAPAVDDDSFYRAAVEQALAYFGSRILYPARPSVRESDLYALYAADPEDLQRQTRIAHRDFMRAVDFLILHKDYETHARRYYQLPRLLAEGLDWGDRRRDYLIEKLGSMLGNELYDRYLEGTVSKRFIRGLFFRKLENAGAARELYFLIAARTAPRFRRALN